MRIKQFLSKIRGFSTPIGGINWDITANEETILYELFQRLGDHRLLRRTHGEFEYAYVIKSLSIMRENVTSSLIKLGTDSKCRHLLENIRECLHEFQTFVEKDYKNNGYRDVIPSNDLISALNAMREVVGSNLHTLYDLAGGDLSNDLISNFFVEKPTNDKVPKQAMPLGPTGTFINK